MPNNLLTLVEQLQHEQYLHDAAAHQDILNALVPKRLTHFTLHFSKYTGALLRARRTRDPLLRHKTLIDSFVIVLASANALVIRLSERLADAEDDTLLKQAIEDQDYFGAYAETVGELAKACEVADHLEAHPSRAVMEASILRLFWVVARWAEHERLDLVAAVRERWAGIEAKWHPGKEPVRPSPKLMLRLS